MKQIPSATPPYLSKLRFRRLFHTHRWLQGPRAAKDGSSFAFGARLLATVLLSAALIGITTYVVLERDLAHQEITDQAVIQATDSRAFEDIASRAEDTPDALHDIDGMLDSVAHRTGTREAILVDSHHVIKEASNDAVVGTIDPGSHIEGALRGRSFAGRGTNGGRDSRNFEFVSPVNVRGTRYAYEVAYDPRAFDAKLDNLRTKLVLIGLLALLGGGAVFYLVGGRRLMRDHRQVLRRATRDGLTDLPNQRAFHVDFPQAIASAARYDDAFALALLDVDDFKLINDRHGHPQGDAILKRVADVLREGRPGDRPYRIGGGRVRADVGPHGRRRVARARAALEP